MKKTLIASVLAITAAFSVQAKDIVDTAVGAGNFKTLAAALTAAGLIDTLKGPGPFTVFAPTDAACASRSRLAEIPDYPCVRSWNHMRSHFQSRAPGRRLSHSKLVKFCS